MSSLAPKVMPLAGRIAFPVAVVLVGLNLRPLLAAIGPLADPIQRATGLTDTGLATLTTLPVALMGACLLASRHIRSRLREKTGIGLGLALILLTCLWRWTDTGGAGLILSAVLGGIGIALVQALMPVVIRGRAGPASAGLMGLYSTAIMGGAMIASMAAPWLEQMAGWATGLGIWALPAMLGLLIWGRTPDMPDTGASQPPPVAHSARAWLLLIFFGLGTGAYTLVLAWLPPFYTRLGWSAPAAGALLGLLTLAEVVAGLAVSVWVGRAPDRRPALLAAIGALLGGLLMLCLAPLALALPAAVLSGLGIGALFPLGLIIAMDHGEGAGEAGAIAGFVQGGGYGLAALLPLAAGLLRQHLADLTPAWWLMAALCLLMMLIAVRFHPTDRIRLSRTP
ncbi:MFS transporter [Azorhizobium oxalatiphilum]|uniref:MFS transporter n=1 Tax=Azorhizobium oxalatiphilum TaxID=980631 RepID=A0A917BW84_9HYPH|nr:MFS transporter [Azorhizobium oxalatiphilum]GGF60815.1 MFS transporter [Azorhizobium oxalatiphilum]